MTPPGWHYDIKELILKSRSLPDVLCQINDLSKIYIEKAIRIDFTRYAILHRNILSLRLYCSKYPIQNI